MPPSRLSIDETDNDDAMLMQSMAASIGKVATFTVDHLVYSQNPQLYLLLWTSIMADEYQ